MRGRLLTIGAVALTGMFCAAAPAAAQIYSWRDGSGQLVLSNRKPETTEAVTSYSVPSGEGVRTTTRYVASSRNYAYDDVIVDASQKNNVRQSLVRAVIQVESAYNPSAYSSKGAMGLMQLMPATAREFGVGNPFDPEQNVRGGVAYLRQLLDRYDQKVDLALAAYNAGSGNVDKYGTVPPFKETRNYVDKITKAAPQAPRNLIYKWIELVEGRPVTKVSNKPPASGSYQIIGQR